MALPSGKSEPPAPDDTSTRKHSGTNRATTVVSAVTPATITLPNASSSAESVRTAASLPVPVCTVTESTAYPGIARKRNRWEFMPDTTRTGPAGWMAPPTAPR